MLTSSSGHFAASLGATTARLSAALAVLHVVRLTLFRAPVADLRAQLANLLRERTVAGDCIGAQAADRRALDTARGTVIMAVLTNHVCETIAAFGRAVVAGGDAVLGVFIQMMTHVFLLQLSSDDSGAPVTPPLTSSDQSP